jgi:hypothetical protein
MRIPNVTNSWLPSHVCENACATVSYDVHESVEGRGIEREKKYSSLNMLLRAIDLCEQVKSSPTASSF